MNMLSNNQNLCRTEEDIFQLKRVNRAEAERLRERWASRDCLEAIANFMQRSRN